MLVKVVHGHSPWQFGKPNWLLGDAAGCKPEIFPVRSQSFSQAAERLAAEIFLSRWIGRLPFQSSFARLNGSSQKPHGKISQNQQFSTARAWPLPPTLVALTGDNRCPAQIGDLVVFSAGLGFTN